MKFNSPARRMVVWRFSIFVMALGIAGCTTVQLNNSTMEQGASISDLEYRMVLDNLAMFRENGDSVPWHLKFSNGLTQIDNSVTPSAAYAWSPITRTLGITGQTGLTVNWTVVPVQSPGQLNLLRDFYKDLAKDAKFSTRYGEGSSPPEGISGHYHGKYVWPKRDSTGKFVTNDDGIALFVTDVLTAIRHVTISIPDEPAAMPAAPSAPALSPSRRP